MTTLQPAQTRAIRSLLVETVEQPPRRKGKGPVLGASALVLAGAVIVGLTLNGAAPNAQAAEALKDAADAAITVSDPVVAPGQFLKVTTEAAYLAYEQGEDGLFTAYLSPSITELFIPADPAAEWVERVTALESTTFYGDAARAAAERDWAATLEGGVVRTNRALGGQFGTSIELGGAIADEPLPGDPAAMLDYLRQSPLGEGTDRGALLVAASLLRTGTITSAERAVLYDALALLPGIRITDGNAVLDGRTGIAFSLAPDGDNVSVDIIIDRETGQFIGQRILTPTTEGAIPAGVPMEYTAVTTTVVDAAP